jgi:hypothetical protein
MERSAGRFRALVTEFLVVALIERLELRVAAATALRDGHPGFVRAEPVDDKFAAQVDVARETCRLAGALLLQCAADEDYGLSVNGDNATHETSPKSLAIDIT